jgi:uncharacterized protein DUF4350
MSGRAGFWLVVVCATLCALTGIWILQNFDREASEVHGKPKPEAFRNPYLAAEMLLRDLGYRVQTVQEAVYLERLPAHGTLILVGGRQYHLTPARTDALFAWVEAGGHVIADAAFVGQSDPILQRFDVRLSPKQPIPKAPEGDEAGRPAGDSASTSASRRPIREPLRRTVSVPGYGRDLRMRANQARPLYLGRIEPSWAVKGGRNNQDTEGVEIVEFPLGAGTVTLINGMWRFSNYTLGADQHAELLAALLATHQPTGEVTLMTRLYVPSIWQWLAEHAQAAVLSAVLLLCGWLWSIIPRFGVLRPDARAERRSLIEHLRAIGRFLWRRQSLDVLLDAARSNLHARLAVRFPVEGPALHIELARLSGLPEAEIALALSSSAPSAAQFTAACRTLQVLERKL